MKLSQLSTAQAKDVLIQVTALTSNITDDKELMDIIGKVMDFGGLNKRGVQAMMLGKYSAFVSGLLKRHWEDLRGILSALNAKSAEEIESQSIQETMRQINDLRDDKELIDFFSSLMRRGKSEQSAPSALVPEASPQEE